MNPFERWLVGFAGALALAGCAQQAPHSAGSSAGAGAGDRHHSAVYPYVLQLGQSVYHVDREPAAVQPSIAFKNWTVSYGAPEAQFSITNPGARAILIWNVRLQVSIGSESSANWRTTESDYPGRGWPRSDIPGGSSAEFIMSSETTNGWRVCLLYSRENKPAEGGQRTYGGTYEVVGPSVRE